MSKPTKEDLKNLYRVSHDPYDGDWTRDKPWVLKKENYETTFSRFSTDRRQPIMPHPDMSPLELARAERSWIRKPSKPQTALVSIRIDDFGKNWTVSYIEGTLRFADQNDRREKQIPSWNRKRR
jgi:hypothetical protein